MDFLSKMTFSNFKIIHEGGNNFNARFNSKSTPLFTFKWHTMVWQLTIKTVVKNVYYCKQSYNQLLSSSTYSPTIYTQLHTCFQLLKVILWLITCHPLQQFSSFCFYFFYGLKMFSLQRTFHLWEQTEPTISEQIFFCWSFRSCVSFFSIIVVHILLLCLSHHAEFV